jgi:hypothetical protein
MVSRKNAMLTTEDRRWLTGEKTYEGEHAKQQRYQRRRDIRERVSNAILDFSILFTHLEDREYEKLFASVSAGGVPRETDADDSFIDGICDALAFLLYNTGITRSMGQSSASTGDTTAAEALLSEALYRAGRRDDILVRNVALDIDATRSPPERLLDDLAEGNDLSPAELRLLMDSDLVDGGDVQQCLRTTLFEDGDDDV